MFVDPSHWFVELQLHARPAIVGVAGSVDVWVHTEDVQIARNGEIVSRTGAIQVVVVIPPILDKHHGFIPPVLDRGNDIIELVSQKVSASHDPARLWTAAAVSV